VTVFVRWLLVWTILNLLVLSLACTASWIPEVQNIIQILVPAINAVLSLLVVFGVAVPAADLTAVTSYAKQANDALSELSSLITQYNQAATASKPGLLTEIDNIAKVVQSNLAQILPALHITDTATIAKVNAVISVVLSEVEDLLQLIPVVQAQLASGGDGITITLGPDTAQPMSPKQFKKAFNAAMSLPTGNAEADAEASKLVLS
jgi:hypothetical protein